MRYAGLLRGINIGESRRIAMADLRAVFEEAGFEDVATYVQSGNIAFSVPGDDSLATRQECERLIADQFGFDVAVILVTAAHLSAVIGACPFREEAESDPTRVHITFLDEMPPSNVWQQIDASAVAPDRLAVGTNVTYMHLPNGMARSRLPDLVARATSKVTATTRNWRTAMALDAMLGA